MTAVIAMRKAVPTILWLLVLAGLTAAGVRRGNDAFSAANPRSMRRPVVEAFPCDATTLERICAHER